MIISWYNIGPGEELSFYVMILGKYKNFYMLHPSKK